MQGRLGDIDDDITQKLMILLSIQVLLVAFTAIVCLGYLIKRYQIRRSMRELDLATQIERRLGKIPTMSPKRAKFWYERTIKRYGVDAHITMEVGVNLANVLVDADRWLEGERLLAKLAATSRRAHGIDYLLNQTTLYVESALKFYKTRVVRLKSRGNEQFELLPYGAGDTTCVVKGPTGDDLINRIPEEEETFTIDIDDLLLQIGTPVICHGMEKSKIQYLNGKIAVVVSWESWINPNKESGIRYELRFEDKNMKQCMLGEKFVRVVFDLPDKEEGDHRRKKMTRL
mmetsp:Transcript_218/g.541  ORF Transcript_218/g.541 Transcript_218/m.541 type:complete len:287 (-) Transcript_218:228-1088(-)|eukprot:CAMPEP_0201892442 /NCGR_PEP_ID=MMETSP0902-20130614/36461_1 /ASSEMBLY_ACC=CAM_ASM_000551 /TAXON_ID=420261 /ORGANISM="Thalassiosira antarctica, Strain CCMP982" /LENGTH=286 /DNA_ID=CAMNT_0048423895 /DNA_START=96 /DNA_END=956 /DNA_ORIENTATION=-